MIPTETEDYLAKLALKEMMKYLISKIPWLGWKLINPIASYVIGLIIEKLLKHTVLGINILLLDNKIENQTDDLLDAVKKAQAITAETPPEEMDKIDDEISQAARKLIDFSRSRASIS